LSTPKSVLIEDGNAGRDLKCDGYIYVIIRVVLVKGKHSEDVVITSSMDNISGDCFGEDACRRLLAMTYYD
jgi:hypothetical protein